jgi:hypothetical protein
MEVIGMKFHYRDFYVKHVFIDEGFYDPKDEQAVIDSIVAVLDYINDHIIDDDIVGLRNTDPIRWFNTVAQDAANEVAKKCDYRIVVSSKTLEEDTWWFEKTLYIKSIGRV